MLEAALVGPLSIFQSLFLLRHSRVISGGDSIEKRDKTDENALLMATRSRQRDTMAYLLCKDVKVTNDTLVEACKEGFSREFELLISRKGLINLTTCIRAVAETGNVLAIQKLVCLGAQFPPTRDEDNRLIRTPLAAAASNGSVEMVRYILQGFGHSILHDRRDCEVLTGLVSAASSGCDAVVALLLDGGADIETRGVGQHTQQTALIAAAARETGCEKVVKLLLSAGAWMENKDAELKTPLLVAVETGSEATIRLLLDAGADINAVLKDGDTTLHIAAKRSRLLVVKWLLDAGADPKAVSRVGATVLSGAITMGEKAPEVVQLLLNAGANPEDMSINGKSAVIEAFDTNKAIFETIISHPLWARTSWSRTIQRALLFYSNDLITALIESGLDLTTQDRDGRAILDLAIRKRWMSIVRLLLQRKAIAFGPFAPGDIEWVEDIRNDINKESPMGTILLKRYGWRARIPPQGPSLFG